MEEKEFIKLAENHIYKEVAKNTNLILGKNKTASLSTGLFLKLPIEVSTEKVAQSLPKLSVNLETLMHRFSAYTKIDDTTKVYFTFMYHDKQDLKTMARYLEKFNMFWAFVYLHEVQHIIRKHVTTSYTNMMMRIADKIQNPHQAINIAMDHAINYSIKDLFNLAGTKVRSQWPQIEEVGMYNKQYHEDQWSDLEILKNMVSKAEAPKTTSLGNGFEKVEATDGKSSIQPEESQGTGDGEEESEKGNLDKCNTSTDDTDIAISDLAESMQEIIRTNTKGSEAGALMEQLFDSIKVETGWFKKIKASFKRQVFYKTHDYTTSWSNLNSTYRHIYKAPKKRFIDDKINIILSVDHSGSMSTEDLQKLLYLIESESTRISSLKVIIHDTSVVKVFDIEDDYDIASSSEFSEALATRYTVGGTSHACVFEYIQNAKIPDLDKTIYLSFSDNYSDIDQVFKNYPIMRKITNYWVCTENNPVHAPGTNITMV